jgi:hypothetical protein
MSKLKDFLDKVVDYERENLRYIGRTIKKDPERLFLGALDPFSTRVWNQTGVGKDWEPAVNQWGGAVESVDEAFAAKGGDPGPGRAMHDIAQTIASMFTMGYGIGKIKSFGASRGWSEQAMDAAIRAAQNVMTAQPQGQRPTFLAAPPRAPAPYPGQPIAQAPPQTFPVASVPVASTFTSTRRPA